MKTSWRLPEGSGAQEGDDLGEEEEGRGEGEDEGDEIV